eukprot:6861924-Prymnesium_polylepis.1
MPALGFGRHERLGQSAERRACSCCEHHAPGGRKNTIREGSHLESVVNSLESASGVDIDENGDVGLPGHHNADGPPEDHAPPAPVPGGRKKTIREGSQLESIVNSLESASGVDLDGDGDVGLPGHHNADGPPDRGAASDADRNDSPQLMRQCSEDSASVVPRQRMLRQSSEMGMLVSPVATGGSARRERDDDGSGEDEDDSENEEEITNLASVHSPHSEGEASPATDQWHVFLHLSLEPATTSVCLSAGRLVSSPRYRAQPLNAAPKTAAASKLQALTRARAAKKARRQQTAPPVLEGAAEAGYADRSPSRGPVRRPTGAPAALTPNAPRMPPSKGSASGAHNLIRRALSATSAVDDVDN